MKEQSLKELRIENYDLYRRMEGAGPRTKAILLANIAINNRKIAEIENVNVIRVNFGGRK